MKYERGRLNEWVREMPCGNGLLRPCDDVRKGWFWYDDDDNDGGW